MSKDDPKAKRSRRDEDPSYITMPPELREFDTGPLQNKVIRPGDDPIFDAAKAALLKLNGGPNADALYYDVKKEQAAIAARMGAMAPGIGNASAYVAPTEVPVAAVGVVEGDEAAKVVISGGDEARPEAAPSPWSNDAKASAEVRASALPSSLRPRETATAADVRLEAQAVRERVRGAVIVVALVVVALGIGVAVLRRGTETGAGEPAPSATPTAPAPSVPEMVAPVPAPPVEPAASATASAAVRAVPSVASAPERPRAVPRAPSITEDPYRDAGVRPPPVVTAAPVDPPPGSPAPTPSPSTAPTATAPVLPGGDKLNL